MKLFDILRAFFFPPERPSNSGVVEAPLRDTDYVVGASPFDYKERLSSGNWTPFTWSQVKQWSIKDGKFHDNLGCTGNALCTSIETQYFFLTGRKIQLSRRWINKMCGTNQGNMKGLGNYIVAPVDFVRKNGFVLEEDYPTPATWTVDEYYAPIPEPLNTQLLKEAKKNKVLYKLSKTEDEDCLKYEYLQITDPNIDKHLKHAPILASIPGHQTCGIFSPTELTTYRDSYEPWDKQYSSTNFKTLLKVIIEPSFLQAGFVKFRNHPEVWFMAKLDSMERLDKFTDTFHQYDGDYLVNNQILTLPADKPF